MSEVLCWCCENYKLIDDNTENGFCVLQRVKVSAYDRVCEDFIKRCGLYTKRTIPDYCKNYKEK